MKNKIFVAAVSLLVVLGVSGSAVAQSNNTSLGSTGIAVTQQTQDYLSASWGSSVGFEATCPIGSIPIAGGAFARDGSGGWRDTQASYPDITTRKWHVRFNIPSSGVWSVKVFATCLSFIP